MHGINANSVLPPPPPPSQIAIAGINILLLGEQGHQSVNSLSRAINQKVGGLGNRTGDGRPSDLQYRNDEMGEFCQLYRFSILHDVRKYTVEHGPDKKLAGTVGRIQKFLKIDQY